MWNIIVLIPDYSLSVTYDYTHTSNNNYDKIIIFIIIFITIWGSNMIFHALTFARSRGSC